MHPCDKPVFCFDFRHQTGLRDVKESAAIFEEMDHYQALGRCMLLSGNIKHALGEQPNQTVFRFLA